MDVNWRDPSTHISPLIAACLLNDRPCVAALCGCDRVNVNQPDVSDGCADAACVIRRRGGLLTLGVSCRGASQLNGRNALYISAAKGCNDALEVLLSSPDVDPNAAAVRDDPSCSHHCARHLGDVCDVSTSCACRCRCAAPSSHVCCSVGPCVSRTVSLRCEWRCETRTTTPWSCC